MASCALLHAEARTGTLRVMDDIMNPTRLDFHSYTNAIRAKLSCRWVPRFVSNDALLADDLRKLAVTAYRDCPWSDESIATMALAAYVWDGFDHSMRQLLPTKEWVADERYRVTIAFLLEHIPREAEYDVRRCVGNKHVRFHAYTEHTAYHVVWLVSSSDVHHACARALLHPQKSCLLIELCHFKVSTVTVHDAARLGGSIKM